jgi:hypothetical protein
MDDVKHTPGPWKVYTAKNGGKIIGIGDAEGGGVTDPNFALWRAGKEQQANARLIAAAPDLLAALEGMMALLDAGSLYEPQAYAARAAIAKARGQ